MRGAVAKTLGALLAAAAAIALGLNATRVVELSRTALLVCIVASAVLAAVSTIAAAWGEWRDRRLGERRELTEMTLTAAVWAVVDQVATAAPDDVAPLDYRDLGVAAYRVRASWWWPSRQRLRRVFRVRASRRLVSSDVDWRPGKGVIGTCVSRGETVALDLAQLYEDLGRPSREEWAELPEDVRLGLGYDEYEDLRDKYAVVVAAPVIDDAGPRSRVVGCVALDGPAGRLPELTTDEVLGLINSAAQALLRQVG